MSKNRVEQKKTLIVMLAVLMLILTAHTALAFSSGSASDTGYELWDFVVNKGLKGAIGATIGVLMVASGCVAAALGKLQGAIWPLIAGGIFISAPSIVTSMGMIF